MNYPIDVLRGNGMCFATYFIPIIIREAGAPDKYKDYLPKDKQYLITRNGKTFIISSSI